MTPSNETPLKPCPFCGSDALLENESYDPTEAWCSCQNKECILWGEVHDPIKWNTRATPDKVMVDRAELEGVRKTLEHAYTECCANLQPKHKEIGTIGFDMAAWISDALQIIEAAMKGDG